MNIYWGDLHVHSSLSDGRRAPADCLASARDAGLDFCALTDYVDQVPRSRDGLLPAESWEQIRGAVREADRPGEFAALLGFERSVPSWDGHTPGSLCVYYRTDDGPLPAQRHPQRDWLRPGAIKPAEDMRALWDELKKTECVKCIAHSCSARQGYTWTAAPTEYEIDLLEIYSKWGACEAPGGPFPIVDGSGHSPRPGGWVRDALAAGFRVGLVGGSDTHFGFPGSDLWENDWANSARYDKSGLTAVLADELSRESVFDALRDHRCYATTFERIRLEFTVNGQPMGSVLSGEQRLRLRVHAVGTRPIKRAEVFRNGEPAHHKIGGREEFRMVFDEPAPTEPTWYYARVTQSGEDHAWSSPIWIEP